MPLVIKKNEILRTLNNSVEDCDEDKGQLGLILAIIKVKWG